MISKNGLLKKSHLYVILDREHSPRHDVLRVATLALSGGANLVQLRDKRSNLKDVALLAKKIKKIAGRYKVPFIVNDRPDVALASNADGLHIGQGDIDISLARRLMTPDKLLGVSAKNFKEAARAKIEGADYIGVGPIFHTPIKSALKPRGYKLLKMIEKLRVPVFAIGGINLKNARMLSAFGFKNIAVIRAVSSSRNVKFAASKLKEAIA